ncbi:MAG: hypothetical protein ACJ8CR_17610 [Roseiflexaceae bacterium]
MTYPEPNMLADALERSARREQRPQVATTLRLAAAQLREDRTVEERLTQLLALIPVERLISVAALMLDARAAEGDLPARDAAAHLRAAGMLVTME